MGRPIKKIKFGTYVGEVGIKVAAYLCGTVTDVFIIKQVGSHKYKVQEVSSGLVDICKLVSGSPVNPGEMLMVGYDNPFQNSAIALKKLTQRRAYDFNGNVYHWELVNDSSADYILLSALV